MNKELQDLAWSILPKEFKEEVKKYYQTLHDQYKDYAGLHFANAKAKVKERMATLEYFFGKHNLTSDADGEEMLTVSRKRVQEMYAHYDKICNDPNRPKDYIESVYEHADGVTMALDDLFGSKCLPDEDSPKEAKSAPATPQKPAEPKFKIGDKVKHSAHPHDDGIYRVDDIKKSSDGFIYHIQGLIGISNVKESDIEPYTEPEKESRNLSKNIANCDKQFDNILKDSLRNERRLNIATQMVKAIMQCPEAVGRIASAEADSLLDDILHDALYLTDRLMSECEKGDSDGN